MVQRTQQLCGVLYLFILSVIWGNEPWNAINEIAVLNHINWCLHSCHSCHKCISRLMSTRRAISQPLLWRASCAFISVSNRAGSWLSSLAMFSSSKDKVKKKRLLQEECAGLGRGARQGPVAGRKQHIRAGRGNPEQCRGLFDLQGETTACGSLLSSGTPNPRASGFCLCPDFTFISFDGCVFHASNSKCRKGKARGAVGAGRRRLTQVNVTEVAQRQKPPEPHDPKSSCSLLRN